MTGPRLPFEAQAQLSADVEKTVKDLQHTSGELNYGETTTSITMSGKVGLIHPVVHNLNMIDNLLPASHRKYAQMQKSILSVYLLSPSACLP